MFRSKLIAIKLRFGFRDLGRPIRAEMTEWLTAEAMPIDPAVQAQLSPLDWDRINLTGDYVWSERLDLDAGGFMPRLVKPYRESMSQ